MDFYGFLFFVIPISGSSSFPHHIPKSVIFPSVLFILLIRPVGSEKHMARVGTLPVSYAQQLSHSRQAERKRGTRGVTKRSRLSWLANSALVYELIWGGGRGIGLSQ